MELFTLLCHLSVGSSLIQTFSPFSGPVRHLHPLTPSSSPITCPTDLFSTSCTRALVSSLSERFDRQHRRLDAFSLLSPPVPSFLSPGGRPEPGREVRAGHSERHGFPPHLGANGFTALPQQQTCHGEGRLFPLLATTRGQPTNKFSCGGFKF